MSDPGKERREAALDVREAAVAKREAAVAKREADIETALGGWRTPSAGRSAWTSCRGSPTGSAFIDVRGTRSGRPPLFPRLKDGGGP